MSNDLLQSVNPFTRQQIAVYESLDATGIDSLLQRSEVSFRQWSTLPVDNRCAFVLEVGEALRSVRKELASAITKEMGKPILQSLAEVDKCAWLCDHYGKHGGAMTEPTSTQFDGMRVVGRRDPQGAVLGIMPWNFPIWQTLRYAIPAMVAGNVALLKPAPNVIGSSLILQRAIGSVIDIPDVFQVVCISVDKVEQVIASSIVRGVTFTGSDRAGSIVASIAGKHIKKTVLELGGSDAFIVLADADIDEAASTYVQSRMNNNGQTCIAAKRCLVQRDVFDDFVSKTKALIQDLSVGDPQMESTTISCIARDDLAQALADQVFRSEARQLFEGGLEQGTNVYLPELYAIEEPDTPMWKEEIFGPVGVVCQFTNISEAVALANDTPYGLGASIWSTDIDKALSVAAEIDAGSVHINKMVSSDPRVPFGGVKRSGYGRELGAEGLYEFVNQKWITVAHDS